MVSTTINFEKEDVQPPVFVAGEFTDWEPVEMAYEASETEGSVKNVFSHKAELEPGHYQYKFRLGPGDWWVLDESTPTSTDEQGNVNNILSVVAQESKKSTQPPTDTLPTTLAPIQDKNDAEVVEDEQESHDTNGSADKEQPAQPNPSSEKTKSNFEKSQEKQPESIVEAPKADNKKQTPLDDLKDKVTEAVASIRKESIPDVAPPPYSASVDGTVTKSDGVVQEAPVEEPAPQEHPAETETDKALPERQQKSFIAQVCSGSGLLVFAVMIGIPVAVSYYLSR